LTAIYAFILGIVQGLCEFLPISSSGHLVLMRDLFGLSEGALGNSALLFDVLLHVGTLAAVVAVFYKDVLDILKHPFGMKMRLLIIATIPAAAVAIFLNDFVKDSFSGAYLGYCFILTSVLLCLSEYVSYKVKRRRKLGLKTAVSMGVMQAVGIFPGVSRSGSTIAGGLFLGANRKAIAKFSFLMSIPAILGSLVMEGKDLLQQGVTGVSWPVVVLGMITSGVTGYFAVRYMLRVIQTKRLYIFALYTLALGIAVLTKIAILQISVLIAGVLMLLVTAILQSVNGEDKAKSL
jgi:undecaprenyl-diphosphatase